MKEITIADIEEETFINYIEAWTEYIEENFGINIDLAKKISLLIFYAAMNGIAFTINSGWRDPAKQKAMQKRWDAGDRSGMIVRPANISKHSITGWLAGPDSHAIDISFSRPELIGHWSAFFGLKWGGNFKKPDKVHFYIEE